MNFFDVKIENGMAGNEFFYVQLSPEEAVALAPYEGKCRFRECLHDREPGCAVTAAAEKGEISSGRLERYRELLAEAKTVWRDRYD